VETHLKLQRQRVSEYVAKDGRKRPYFKFLVLVPNELISALGWEGGAELGAVPAGDVLVLFRKRRTREGPPDSGSTVGQHQITRGT
jgi:hypothetical protein